MNNPIKDRDLNAILRFPDVISWSSLNAFTDYDKDEWFNSYVLGIRKPPNAIMQGGIDVGERIIDDPTFLPSIPRGGIFEQEFFAMLGKIKITGHLDNYFHEIGIDEFKTTSNPKRWTQKAVDNWGQITFYCLLVWLNHKIPPEKLRLRLYAIPMKEDGNFTIVQKGEPACFHTKRSMTDILKFAVYIKAVHKEMVEYCRQKGYDI